MQPYSYLWSTGAITEDENNLNPGTYWVNVFDANGCSYFQTYVIENDETCFCAPITDIFLVVAANNSATIYWLAHGNAQSYIFRYRTLGSNNWVTFSIPNNLIILNNLNDCTIYEYQVFANCGNGVISNESQMKTFELADDCITSCPFSQVFTNNLQLFSDSITVESFIEANGFLNANNTLYFQAGDYILLLPTFEAKLNSTFEADILDCTQ